MQYNEDVWAKTELCSVPNDLVREVVDKYSRTYCIKYIDDDYILTLNDMNGFTLILSTADKPINVYIPKTTGHLPIGRCITIGQETHHTVTIVKTKDVEFHPRDGHKIRREGGVISLIYEGEQRWRLIGELP